MRGGALPDPREVAAGAGALLRSGIVRPLGPRVLGTIAHHVRRGSPKAALLYAIHAADHPSDAALVFEGRTTTWAGLQDRIRRLANHLRSLGVGPGDGVAIMLPNRPEFLEAQGAGILVGAHVSFIGPKVPASQAQDLIQRTSSKVLFTDRDDVPAPHVITVGDAHETAISGASDAEPPVPGEDTAARVVIFTSGTTGRPKGAVRNLDDNASVSAFAGFLRVIPFKRGDVHMVVCPLYHSSGSGFATVSQVLGSPLVLVERFSEEAFCRTVQEHRVTTTAVVPTMLQRICAWERTKEFDLSSLRVVVCTGSPLREEVRADARALLGDVIYDLYGSTEMGWVSVASPADQRTAPGSVGRIVPGVDVKVCDPDGNPVAPGERGEIWAASRALMERYLDDPDLTTERVRDGYVSVRDVGYVDDRGYLYVVDRADDMIISGGVNVYPAEAEVALSSHPNVAEASVFGVPDPDWGQKVVAAVVASAEVDTDELVAWCRQHASAAAVPKEIRLVDALPRNDIGKVNKRALTESWNG
ncbi:MAG TPA: AMP-binding protein [Actinomycetota bacterium]|nr:AMP-binding protein [Actinomycetota bacterium]